MNRRRLKDLLKHRDIIELQSPEPHCSWCYVSTNRKATHKVWSHEWLMYMYVCARHAVRIAWKNNDL